MVTPAEVEVEPDGALGEPSRADFSVKTLMVEQLGAFETAAAAAGENVHANPQRQEAVVATVIARRTLIRTRVSLALRGCFGDVDETEPRAVRRGV